MTDGRVWVDDNWLASVVWVAICTAEGGWICDGKGMLKGGMLGWVGWITGEGWVYGRRRMSVGSDRVRSAIYTVGGGGV